MQKCNPFLRKIINPKYNKMQINEEISVRWRHFVADKFTKCIINVSDREHVAHAKCSDVDTFSKKKGRKVSLIRALSFLESKSDRRLIWNTLRERGVKI
jgi:hypothetical protein